MTETQGSVQSPQAACGSAERWQPPDLPVMKAYAARMLLSSAISVLTPTGSMLLANAGGCVSSTGSRKEVLSRG